MYDISVFFSLMASCYLIPALPLTNIPVVTVASTSSCEECLDFCFQGKSRDPGTSTGLGNGKGNQGNGRKCDFSLWNSQSLQCNLYQAVADPSFQSIFLLSPTTVISSEIFQEESYITPISEPLRISRPECLNICELEPSCLLITYKISSDDAGGSCWLKGWKSDSSPSLSLTIKSLNNIGVLSNTDKDGISNTDEGLSGDSIIAIAVGIIAAVLLLLSAVTMFVCHKRRKKRELRKKRNALIRPMKPRLSFSPGDEFNAREVEVQNFQNT